MSPLIDFLKTYWPTSDEIDPERASSIRDSQSLLIETAVPDVDTSPGTTLGDLHVTPGAWDKAATEIAWERFASDLDPENARKGTVWNCDFVQAYFRAFGVEPQIDGAWGLARMVFSTDDPVTIDRSTTFEVARNSFRVWLPKAGPLYLNQVEDVAENHKTLTRIGTNLYAVDVILQGATGLTGSTVSVQVDRDIEGLVSVNLLAPLQAGAEPTSLQEQARRLRSLNNCRQPVTRGGATGMVTTRFPEITSVSAVLSGDLEQVRDDLNPILLPGGKVDLCVKSSFIIADSMTVRLVRSGTGTPYYSGMVEFPSPAITVDSVTFDDDSVAWELVQVPTDELPGVSGAYTDRQQLFLRVEAGDIPSTLVDGDLVADFVVAWQMDIAQKVVSEWLQSDENNAAGIDILARWFTPYEITSLDVWYNRKGGVTFDRDTARKEILSAFNLHHIDNPAGSHTVGDIMYWAGAHSVHRLQMTAELITSPATQWYDGEFVQPEDDADWVVFDAALVAVPTRSVTEIIDFDPTHADAPASLSIGPRNFSWKLAGANLRLIERATL